jgi:hypothetical protein
MNSFRQFSTALLVAAGAFATPLRAQEKSPEKAAPEEVLTSGPSVGTKLTPVKCYATTGALAGQEFDAAELLGNAPCALLFINELTRNTAPVLRGLDSLTTEFSILGFKSFTIMLSGDRTASEAQLKRVNGSLRAANPIALSIDGAEGPGNYALNRKAALTVIFAKEGKVTQSLALTDTGPNDVPVLRKAIVTLTGELPTDPAALRNLVANSLPTDPKELKRLAADQMLELKRLRAQLVQLRQQARAGGGGAMRRQAAPPRRPRPGGDSPPQGRVPTRPNATEKPARQGRAPDDSELNSLLRSFIRQTNDKEKADAVFADIEERAAKSGELNTETIEMFKLMLSFPDRYGTAHAQGLAKLFLKKNTPARKEK